MFATARGKTSGFSLMNSHRAFSILHAEMFFFVTMGLGKRGFCLCIPGFRAKRALQGTGFSHLEGDPVIPALLCALRWVCAMKLHLLFVVLFDFPQPLGKPTAQVIRLSALRSAVFEPS